MLHVFLDEFKQAMLVHGAFAQYFEKDCTTGDLSGITHE